MIEHFPNDKATIFSIVPLQIGPEVKPGIYPGAFTIPACVDEIVPVRLVVGASEHLSHIGGRTEPLRQITPSYQVAKSIVDDYLMGQLFSKSGSHPGVCWVQGDVTVSDFLKQHTETYTILRATQKSWYRTLVQETEDDWKRYQSHKVVSHQARLACRALGINAEWLRAEETLERPLLCPACAVRNHPANAVCTNCRCILDEEKFKTLKFA